jgi:flagellar hook-basal body complex protein FliE
MLAAVNLIAAVPGAASAGVTHSLAAQANRPAASSPFANLITDALGQITQLEAHAQTTVSGPMTGPMTGFEINAHHRMIATQKTDTAFELALAVRNEAVQAYQSVMAMQF